MLQWVALLKWRPEMTTSVVSSTAIPFSETSDESKAPAARAYRTRTSFVAVHFNQEGKGRIVFLPDGAMLRVIGLSSCLPEGFEVVFENQRYNVFGIDLFARSSLIREPIQAKDNAIAACA
jgi:hypothetical protein